MGSAIATWFASKGAGLLLGFLGKLLTDYLQGRQANQAMRDAGAAQTASTINRETADAERRAASVDDLTDDGARKRLESGSF